MNIETISYLVVLLFFVVPWLVATVSLIRSCWIFGDCQLAETRLAEEKIECLKRCDCDPHYFR